MAGWVTEHEIFEKNKRVALQKGSMVRKKDLLIKFTEKQEYQDSKWLDLNKDKVDILLLLL